MIVKIDKSCSPKKDPIEETKNLLKSNKSIAICTVLDDYSEVLELERLLNEMGLECEISDFKGKFQITTAKGNPEAPIKVNNNFLLYIDKSYENSTRLEEEFLEDYFNNLSKLLIIPKFIVLINDGVKLLKHKNYLSNLIELKKLGTEILICEKSLDFFSINYENQLGNPVKLSEIISVQLNSDKIIKL